MNQAKPQPYKVRDIRVVAKGADVLVREYTLDPGEAIPGTATARCPTTTLDWRGYW